MSLPLFYAHTNLAEVKGNTLSRLIIAIPIRRYVVPLVTALRILRRRISHIENYQTLLVRPSRMAIRVQNITPVAMDFCWTLGWISWINIEIPVPIAKFFG